MERRIRDRTRVLVAVAAVAMAAPALGPLAGTPEAVASSHDEHVDLKLLVTNDLHGRLQPYAGSLLEDPQGGMAYLATHLKQVQSAHPATLYVDVGDATDGNNTGPSGQLGGEPMIEILDAMGLDVQALGNHDFDDGTSALERRYEGGCANGDCSYRDGRPYPGASWPALTGNVHDGDDGPLFADTWLTEVEGVTVGFLGVTATNEIVADGNEGLVMRAWDEVANDLAAELEAAGADVVVAARHLGTNPNRLFEDPNSCVGWEGDAANYVRDRAHPAIDVVVDGHTHRAYVCDEPGTPLTTQARDRSRMYTEIDLTVDTAQGDVVTRSARNHWVTHDVERDPEVQAIIEDAQEWTSGSGSGSGGLLDDLLG